ncbi:oxidoreductase [Agromyces rhizosphaerae]|uniref:Oxidoreductase n=1 Tax=Agromyces rhizosphaerae TaxID=88374 RepID=A0A9W6CU31_9MICO|nr:LLM class flavin-dependent oxidoreductase [Agromyces rhizosphaerae]GLI26410.1 oxidoreductase [Agromyces rhizosphaerae]
MRRIGAIFQPAFPPERMRSAVEAADRSGVHELWLFEDCFREAAFSAAGAALAWSERMRVGIGIAPMPLRNVALTAMEIATVDRMFPGRFIPGLGHGVLSWMGQTGSRVASPLTLMREYVPAVRALLAGDELTTDGRYVSLDRVRLDWPPAAAPAVYAAGQGPKTLRLTGEVADGTVINEGTTPAMLRNAIALVEAGREASGRGGRNDIIVYLLAAFGGDDARARMAADAERWGFAEDPAKFVAGDDDEVAAAAELLFDAGADSVVLQPTHDEPDLEAFMEHSGRVASAVQG